MARRCRRVAWPRPPLPATSPTSRSTSSRSRAAARRIIKGGVLDRDQPRPPATRRRRTPAGCCASTSARDPFDGSHPGPFPPQLDQIDAHLNANGTGFKTLDALILGAGGNDAASPPSWRARGRDHACRPPRRLHVGRRPEGLPRCAPRAPARSLRPTRRGAARLTPLDADDAALSASHVPEAVLLTAIPAVARKTSTSFCSSEPSGDQTAGVTSSEASMLENTVRIPLDDNMQDAAQAQAGRSSTATSTTSSATRSARPTAGSTRTTRPCAGRATSRHRSVLLLDACPSRRQRGLGPSQRARLPADRRGAVPRARPAARAPRRAAPDAVHSVANTSAGWRCS